MTLFKTTTLMDAATTDDGRYVGEGSVDVIALSGVTWDEMKRPKVITVTVEIGDTLNEESE